MCIYLSIYPSTCIYIYIYIYTYIEREIEREGDRIEIMIYIYICVCEHIYVYLCKRRLGGATSTGVHRHLFNPCTHLQK